jgi:hypothetical protein
MEVITRDARCPMDRRSLGVGDLFEPPPPTELTQAPIHGDDIDGATDLRTGSSAKIEQLLHLLRLSPENEKSLVFSQFTSFLDKVSSLARLYQTAPANGSLEKIAEVLDEEGFVYLRCPPFLHSQSTYIGSRTSDSMERCLQSGDKKLLRHFVFRLNTTRR